MNQVVRIGMVGCGGIAEVHRRAIEQLADVRITAVHDRSRAAAEAMAAKTGASVADSPQAMIDGGEVDAVVICTPPGGRASVCLPFIEAGVAVLCEKPLETTPAAAQQLAEAVERTGSVFMIGFCHRFHGPIIELRRLIDSGRLGRPVLMRNIFAAYLPLANNHRSDPAIAGGGCMIDNGTHSVDLFRHLVGEPAAVHAMGGTALQELRVEDLSLLNLTTAEGAFGEITSSFSLKVTGNWLEWYGSEGTAIVSYGNAGQPDLSYRIAGDEAWTPVDCSSHPMRFVGQWQRFVAAVRAEAQAWPTVQDGARACEVISAAYTAMRDGRTQRLEAPLASVPLA